MSFSSNDSFEFGLEEVKRQPPKTDYLMYSHRLKNITEAYRSQEYGIKTAVNCGFPAVITDYALKSLEKIEEVYMKHTMGYTLYTIYISLLPSLLLKSLSFIIIM